jgi:hypothetical protein hydSNDRAFT_0623
METKDKYIIWTPEDFAEGNIQEAARYICANVHLIHLLQPSAALPLYEAIKRLADADNDPMTLTQARFAYNIEFILPAELFCCAGKQHKLVGAVRSLAELIDFLPLNENGGLSIPHCVVIDDNAISGQESDKVRELMAGLLQQFVFLNLDLDVMSKSEIRKNEIKERFRKHYPELERRLNCVIDDMEKALGKQLFSPKGLENAHELRSSLEGMQEDLEKARKRPIRIAAMGTKKAGKSVIINCLLGQEYAPTSSELPTPNVIRYVPETTARGLWLEYNGESMTFPSAERLKAFIQGEFEEAQRHTGDEAALEEMVVHYPTEELTGFEIYDTPGPDFAGAGESHAVIAEACIKDADVCIFVMNYSKHLETGEVAFLEKIRNYFQENGKFYSLLIAVNRVDERYSAEVEKSLSRVIDYIRTKLGALGYPHIVTFGTSALQSFYLAKIRELCVEEGHPEGAPIDADAVKALKKTHKNAMTRLSFIQEALGRLEDFHAYEEPTDYDLERMSGVPQLVRYVRYIGEQKADLEIVDHVIGSCEMKAKSVKNALEVTKLVESRDRDSRKIKQLESYVRRLNKEVKRILNQLGATISEESVLAAETQVRHSSANSEKKARDDAEDRIRALVDRLEVFPSDMEEIYGNKPSAKIGELQKYAAEAIDGVSTVMAQTIQNGITAYCDGKREQLSAALQDTQEQIREEVEKIDRELEQEKDVQSMFRSFELPSFPASVEIPTTAGTALANLFETGQLRKIAASKRREYEVERGTKNLWEGIRSFLFGKKYYETRVAYNVEGFKADLTESMTASAQQAISDTSAAALQMQIEEATSFVGRLYQQREEYEGDYQQIFDSYLNMLNLLLDDTNEHKEAVQRDIEAFKELSAITKEFFELFDTVVPGRREE